MMTNSNISGFYKMTVAERVEALSNLGLLTPAETKLLKSESQILSADIADNMSENVIGVFGLPFSIATNFLINNQDYIVPMVTEEPSIVAGVSGAAKIIRMSGGFSASIDQSLLIGQIQLLDIKDAAKIVDILEQNKQMLITIANLSQPNLKKRGGGVRDIEIHILKQKSEQVIVLHILVDTRDAMGANLVNTVCEYLADDVVNLTGCKVGLKILSNLTDRSLVDVQVKIPPKYLAKDDYNGLQVRDSIVNATEFADADPYRAATHNKGIMNGIDAVAIATGNDWRSIESAAHAYACHDGRYRSLTEWLVDTDGNLVGKLKIPIKVGIVGGSLMANPAAQIGLKIANASSANELAIIIASVGLAQNLAALRALTTHGIQKGHMKLHARSVATSIDVPEKYFTEVVNDMISSGEIKAWKAQEILASKKLTETGFMNNKDKSKHLGVGVSAGKIILLGEHAVVYNEYAIALPIEEAVYVEVQEIDEDCHFVINGSSINISDPCSIEYAHMVLMVEKICNLLNIDRVNFKINIVSRIPLSMGLGASASYAVAITRGLIDLYKLPSTNKQINDIAFECEKISHGNPSGIDNTVASYAQPILYNKKEGIKNLNFEDIKSLPILIALSNKSSRTIDIVNEVYLRYENNKILYKDIFKQLGKLSKKGLNAIQNHDYEQLGILMNVAHGLLNAIGVSNAELEEMIDLARSEGALGAKITGSGGGGSIIILCPGKEKEMAKIFELAGYKIIPMHAPHLSGINK
ncbi:MAG: hydroxymethylglutaryl-CoA reductase, degradative [Woeseiaceae bacterium]